jgi:hypothetical protein
MPSLEKQLRFRIYSQERKIQSDLAPNVAQTLLRLWQYNFNELGFDHRLDFNKQTVDVYLCWSGNPGGEQLFDYDRQTPPGQLSKVNTVYIYDLPSFTKPIEKLREVAHEYGHASLPAVGGYNKPEYWANGYLGEKLFLTNLAKRRDLVLMNCSLEEVRAWVSRECEPLMLRSALSSPELKIASPMNQYIGQMLWLQQLLPAEVLGRVLKNTGGLNQTQIPRAAAEAIEGVGRFEVNVPQSLTGKLIWLPFEKMRCPGLTIKAKTMGWIQVVAPAKSFSVNPRG